MRTHNFRQAPLRAFGLLLPIAALAGCAAFNPSATSTATAAASISGSVHGGQQPVSGALITLVAPGTIGYGSAGSILASVTTDNLGRFTLPSSISCPSNNGLVYLLATGGDAGAGTNPALAEAVILGPCSSINSSTFVNITEVTTVAAAYALAPFYTPKGTIPAARPAVVPVPPSAAIGTSPTNLQGLANAAGTANNLASSASGLARTTASLTGIVPPTAEINTLADILSACVNQGTTVATNGACATLFTATTPSGYAAPTDTFQAALNIAQHPGTNVSTLFGLSTANAPYQTALGTAPTDFSVALGFTGGAITTGSGTISVAIDAAGDAWITTGYFSNTHTLTEISPSGTYLSGSTVAGTTGYGSGSLINPVGLAIDQNGSVYVANNGSANLQKFNSGGSLLSTITAASFSGPNSVAIDGAGNPWVANFGGNKVTEITTAGVEAPTSPYTVGSGGVDIAISPTAVWETDYQSNFLSRIDLTSHAVTNLPTGGSNAGIALDNGNNAWVVTTGTGTIQEYSNSGALLTPAGGLSPNGSVFPQNIAIDGLGNVFSGAYLGQSSMGALIEYSSGGALLSPSVGYKGSGVIPVLPLTPGGIAIDGSGNVWLTGTNNSTSFPNYVTEIIGLAAPVVTPRAVATTNSTLGTRP